MAKETVIRGRAELGRYLQNQAEELCRLSWQVSTLRGLVAEAHATKERMPKGWTVRAVKALREIKE